VDVAAHLRGFSEHCGTQEQLQYRSFGGQQQMVAIGGRHVQSATTALRRDISRLAPVVVRELYQRLTAIRSEGVAMVIVEQDITQAMALADRLYCLGPDECP